MTPPSRGLFITLEGPEGAGKTTQARLLADHLRRSYDVLYTREPGGSPLGERIRALLLDERHREMTPETEMLLFAASRAQFVAQTLEPALRAGRLVLCERYVDASLAYQGYGRGLGVEVVRAVNEVATRGVRPDLTVLLDIDPAVGLIRARQAGGKEGRIGRGDRLEQEDLAFFTRVREGFLAIASKERDRIRLVDGNRPPQVVHEEIVRLVEAFLGARGWRASSSS
ncbi:MAG: dTMP kinase [Armatimonadota bacterium]|nr:dTMP kinase [Armatimonadota bacterium]MDR7451693.1 dTMP kinase [Armatimonadota bacterium]MDR7465689.1 dTMP kinase [Armatimonadota bacterium]MDR7493598.1 dTMP kinase [Armatimonadota bacterium]MDR7499498.1 dTMP kinase [Armatimonadota bacterium]